MKKSILTIIVAIIVIVTIIFWLFIQKSSPNSEILQIPILFVIVGLGLYVGVSRLKSERKGLPAEDELSRKLLTKASSISFYASLYYLLILGYLSDRIKLENHSLIGVGIIGMAILFVISWIFFKIKGLKNDE